MATEHVESEYVRKSRASATRWLAVWTKPRQEECARQHLERQGFEVLLPHAQERKRCGTRMLWQTNPLFPRYLFVRANLREQSIAPIRSTRGCVGPVRIAGQPAFVPSAVISELRHRTATPPVLDPSDKWRADQLLQITDGPLAGLTALFQTRDGDARVRVLLHWLGQWQRANLSLAVLEEAD